MTKITAQYRVTFPFYWDLTKSPDRYSSAIHPRGFPLNVLVYGNKVDAEESINSVISGHKRATSDTNQVVSNNWLDYVILEVKLIVVTTSETDWEPYTDSTDSWIKEVDPTFESR